MKTKQFRLEVSNDGEIILADCYKEQLIMQGIDPNHYAIGIKDGCNYQTLKEERLSLLNSDWKNSRNNIPKILLYLTKSIDELLNKLEVGTTSYIEGFKYGKSL
jgi:hypothetical protein